jgi:hypothetical protein
MSVMGETGKSSHSAEGSALGFWYQSLYALLLLVSKDTDNAAVGIEQLDDIELKADGHTLLYQLKHSITKKPSPVGIKSPALWRTVKVWADLLPKIELAETSLHLVTVGGLVEEDPLISLTDPNDNREALVDAMSAEASRVVAERARAREVGEPLPHAVRKDGCEAFLKLSEAGRLNLLLRVTLKIDSPTVDQIEKQIEHYLTILPAEQRPQIAKRLVEWWDRQVVYSLCGKRERVIARTEFQVQLSEVVAEVDRGKLVAHFETLAKPFEYQADGMLSKQIALVNGRNSDFENAIREEWKARSQRARWATDNPAMSAKINEYDIVLKQYWEDLHKRMVEDCADIADEDRRRSGLDLLRWTHDKAPNTVRPIEEGFGAAYYVRGSYQVLAISLLVGWHPNFEALLKDKK